MHTSLLLLVSGWHRALDELFAEHQDALLRGDLDEAADLLDRYVQLHERHGQIEDIHLLPALAELDDPGPWPASLYTHEHNKLRELFTRTRSQLDAIRKRNLDGRPLRQALIGLLDEEKTLKGVCAHHQEREEKGLLPALDSARPDLLDQLGSDPLRADFNGI